MAAEANRWLEDFEHVANLSAERQQSAARAAVGSLDQRLQAMEANPTHYRLGAREVRRRRGLMDDLKRQCGMQDTAPKVYGGGTFVRPDGGGTSRGAGAGANRDLLLEQRRMMDEQDVIVEEIGKGVDRLHTRALNIHEETNLQKNLLDDMDYDVEAANSGLKKEAQHAMKIRQRSGNCHLYICIVVLLFVLILLLILGFQQ